VQEMPIAMAAKKIAIRQAMVFLSWKTQ